MNFFFKEGLDRPITVGFFVTVSKRRVFVPIEGEGRLARTGAPGSPTLEQSLYTEPTVSKLCFCTQTGSLRPNFLDSLKESEVNEGVRVIPSGATRPGSLQGRGPCLGALEFGPL